MCGPTGKGQKQAVSAGPLGSRALPPRLHVTGLIRPPALTLPGRINWTFMAFHMLTSEFFNNDQVFHSNEHDLKRPRQL